jgi:hypothetical protein
MSENALRVAAVSAGETLGLELEMGVVDRESGQSACVTDVYFERLAEIKRRRGERVLPERLEGRQVSLSGPLGNSGLDNGFNLLETSFSPVREDEGGLETLAARVRQELRDVEEALEAENLTLLNASEHPACVPDGEWYLRARVPRPIYKDWVEARKWRHFVGMDAKAQNGPCTSIDTSHAVRALNVMLSLAPVFIALFANSPLAAGKETGLKENRLTIWEEMFRDARFPGDLRLCRLPIRPFEDLGDYFHWMFGAGTVSQALPQVDSGGAGAKKRYKSVQTFHLEGDPALEHFLCSASWTGRRDAHTVLLVPSAEHFVHAQFAHFLDARWRYALDTLPDLKELLDAWDTPGGIETLFARHGARGYIEGRAPGCVLPDQPLLEEAGSEIAATTPLSASALQLGLLRNLAQAETLARDKGWNPLRELRPRAIRHALEDDEIHALAQDALSIAHAGLSTKERHWLAYADYVLQTRRTAADRMLSRWREVSFDWRKLVKRRAFQLP